MLWIQRICNRKHHLSVMLNKANAQREGGVGVEPGLRICRDRWVIVVIALRETISCTFNLLVPVYSHSSVLPQLSICWVFQCVDTAQFWCAH